MSYLPFANLDIENLISQKTITARSFKLRQLVYNQVKVFKKKFPFWVFAFYIFLSDCPLQIGSSKTYYNDISKMVTASSLRFGQLTENCK